MNTAKERLKLSGVMETGVMIQSGMGVLAQNRLRNEGAIKTLKEVLGMMPTFFSSVDKETSDKTILIKTATIVKRHLSEVAMKIEQELLAQQHETQLLMGEMRGLQRIGGAVEKRLQTGKVIIEQSELLEKEVSASESPSAPISEGNADSTQKFAQKSLRARKAEESNGCNPG